MLVSSRSLRLNKALQFEPFRNEERNWCFLNSTRLPLFSVRSYTLRGEHDHNAKWLICASLVDDDEKTTRAMLQHWIRMVFFIMLQHLRAKSAKQCVKLRLTRSRFSCFALHCSISSFSTSGLRPLLLNMRSARISYKHPATLINTIMLMIQYKILKKKW